MKTELELEFKKETGFRPKPQNNLYCEECNNVLLSGEFYTSDFVDFLIAKNRKTNQMKTVKEIQKQIKENANLLVAINKDIDDRIEVKRNKATAKRIKKENQLLRQCELYIKSNPREEYLKNELKTLKERISSIESHFGEWAETNSGKFKNLYSAYKKAMGIPRIQMQIKTLKYLLL